MSEPATPKPRPIRARRSGKNHWTYDCTTCGYVHKSVDEFGAYEAGWRHVRTLPHIGQTLVDAFKPLGEAFRAASNSITEAFGGLSLPVPGSEWHSNYNPKLRVRILEADMDAMVVSYRHIDSAYQGQRGLLGMAEFIGPNASYTRIRHGR